VNATPTRVAAVIPAKDEAHRIGATVRSALTIPGVDLVLVVDDGSSDATAELATDAGAEVVSHPVNRGKAAAMETGAAAVAARERGDQATPRALLFIDGDLADTAANTAALTGPVLAGRADMTIAILPRQSTAGGGRGLVVNLSRRGIVRATGWTPTQPLSGMRCLTREAFEAARPLATGWGVETALTIDLLRAGFRVVEVPCDLQHRVSGRDLRAHLHRAGQYRDVARALAVRRFRRSVPRG
jgi:glycosyltransferase involved in cell wall biosynthesis